MGEKHLELEAKPETTLVVPMYGNICDTEAIELSVADYTNKISWPHICGEASDLSLL